MGWENNKFQKAGPGHTPDKAIYSLGGYTVIRKGKFPDTYVVRPTFIKKRQEMLRRSSTHNSLFSALGFIVQRLLERKVELSLDEREFITFHTAIDAVKDEALVILKDLIAKGEWR